MEKYLENELVEFIPLFNIDYTIKKDLICSCFFKLEISYKNFDKYIDGLKKNYNDVIKYYSKYTFRLFININIYNDIEIMNKLKGMTKLELVLYKCLDPKLIGLFPTLIRFFPMFNFNNNDSNVVIVVDIDDDFSSPASKCNVINIFTNIKNNVDKKIINKTYFINLDGKLSRNMVYKYKTIYKNIINAYVWARCIVNIKKINKNVIINFINKVKYTKKIYSYYKYINIDKNEYNIKFIKYKPFVYGIDEYFINKTLIRYLIKNKKLFINKINWTLLSHFYYYNNQILKHSYSDKKIIIKEFFIYLLNKINYKIKTDSIIELYNIIDKLLYKTYNKKLVTIIYDYILANSKNENLKIIFPEAELTEILLKPENYGVYSFEKIMFSNPKYKEIILNQVP